LQHKADQINWADIGKRIKEKRKAAGLTQEELAHKSFLETPTINKIENNKSKVKLSSLIKIANALEVSSDELLCGSLNSCTKLYHGEIMEKLSSCDPVELNIIKSMVECLVEQLEKSYKDHISE